MIESFRPLQHRWPSAEWYLSLTRIIMIRRREARRLRRGPCNRATRPVRSAPRRAPAIAVSMSLTLVQEAVSK